jgi:hypothetical protein
MDVRGNALENRWFLKILNSKGSRQLDTKFNLHITRAQQQAHVTASLANDVIAELFHGPWNRF